MSSLLTLVVFLKDRFEFTKRLCSYLSEIKYPYPVYFADGSMENDNENFFKNLKTDHFQYVYKRYPKDLTLHDYYKKSSKSFNEVRTPYLMFTDNDDFPIPSGQGEAISFLEENRDFVGCNGQVSGISLYPDVGKAYGQHFLFYPHYCKTMDSPVDLNQDSGVKRIEEYLKNFYSVFYSVFRTESIVKNQTLITELNFSDLGVYELFFSYMQLAQGKIHSINSLTYIRQKGSSQAAASQKDWFYRLFYTNWLQDCKNAIFSISSTISDKEKIDREECFNVLYEMFVNRMRNRFINNQFYFFKNPHLFFRKENIINIFLNKFFRFFPCMVEKLSCVIYFKNKHVFSDLKTIKKIITKKNKNDN